MKTTIYQRANFVVSIGCPRKWEICNDDNRVLPRGVWTYRHAKGEVPETGPAPRG